MTSVFPFTRLPYCLLYYNRSPGRDGRDDLPGRITKAPTARGGPGQPRGSTGLSRRPWRGRRRRRERGRWQGGNCCVDRWSHRSDECHRANHRPCSWTHLNNQFIQILKLLLWQFKITSHTAWFKARFRQCDSDCHKPPSHVNTLIDIHKIHSEMKSLSQLHRVNGPFCSLGMFQCELFFEGRVGRVVLWYLLFLLKILLEIEIKLNSGPEMQLCRISTSIILYIWSIVKYSYLHK